MFMMVTFRIANDNNNQIRTSEWCANRSALASSSGDSTTVPDDRAHSQPSPFTDSRVAV